MKEIYRNYILVACPVAIPYFLYIPDAREVWDVKCHPTVGCHPGCQLLAGCQSRDMAGAPLSVLCSFEGVITLLRQRCLLLTEGSLASTFVCL
jgi:hypothetical protein